MIFWKPETFGQTVLPDRSILVGQKLGKNTKIEPVNFSIFRVWPIFKNLTLSFTLSHFFSSKHPNPQEKKETFYIRRLSSGKSQIPAINLGSRNSTTTVAAPNTKTWLRFLSFKKAFRTLYNSGGTDSGLNPEVAKTRKSHLKTSNLRVAV